MSTESKAQFPKRIRVVNVAASHRDEVELQVVPDELEPGDLPVASYVKGDDATE